MAKAAGFGEGITLAIEQLERLDRDVPLSLAEATLEAAVVLADEAKRAAPRQTGRLVSSIGAEPYNADGDSAASQVIVKEFYARFLEYGTVKMAARPFLRSSADRKEKEISSIIARAVERRVKIRSFKR